MANRNSGNRSRPARGPARGRAPGLTQLDFQMMSYIWKWKVASTASVHEALNRPNSPYSTYKRLGKLEHNGWLETHFDVVHRFYVWQLTKLGFDVLKLSLGELSEQGYLSENHHHDRLVQAFQLGEWATHQFPLAEFFTEQQLRRMDVELYPTWVPKTKEHRPDGYSRFTSEKRPWLFAYEVEISAKALIRYEGVMRFYRSARSLDRVLWLVGSPYIKSQILKARETIREDCTNYHVFVDLHDYLQNGWDAWVVA